MYEEKRKFKRLRCREGAFAAFLKGDELINMGQVIDVSLGGVCFQYLATAGSDEAYSEVKIFGSNGHFIHLERVQCRVVYDREVPDGGSWGKISTRRCGVQFEELSVRNLAILEEFISHFCFDQAGCKDQPGS